LSDSSHNNVAAPATAAGSTEQSFPLIALLQLATFLAAIAACVDGRELVKQFDRATQKPLEAALVIVLAATVVAAIGFVIGLGQLRAVRSATVGGAFGATLGVAILAIYIAPGPPTRTAGAVGVMLISTIAIRIRAA
jgi:ABC-type antimicrobial peptide transport system permease subunit